jgi:hypothetical protein
VQDVLEQIVVVGVGDEPLDAVDVPGTVGLLDRLGAAAPTSDPASGSVSTIVSPQWRSLISDAQCRRCSLPMV